MGEILVRIFVYRE